MSDWIEWNWTEEKPYPETLDTNVEVIYKGEEDESKGIRKPSIGIVAMYAWHHDGEDDDITHYRLA